MGWVVEPKISRGGGYMMRSELLVTHLYRNGLRVLVNGFADVGV